MKAISILSLAQAYNSLEAETYANLLRHYDISIKNDEANDLSSLVGNLYSIYQNAVIFNEFYVGYKIPQIGKEFDLLRLGENFIVNVELKRISSIEKIQTQLLRNKYYLSTFGKPLCNFTFVSSTNELYFLNDSNVVQLVEISYLIQVLGAQVVDYVDDIDKLFNPSVYLVSPFNSTDKFINDEYFLTLQQEEIKRSALDSLTKNWQSNFISITGSAGTGKTLLVYDIAKSLIGANNKVLIIHCGNLNDGQVRLKTEYNWDVIPIKHYRSFDLSIYNMIIIDEAQRIKPQQLEEIVNTVKSTNGNCVFSYDKIQTLSTTEEYRNIDAHINNIDQIISYKLTEKIRTNKEIASFIKALFNKNKKTSSNNRGNVELNYFSTTEDAKYFLDSISNQGWEVLRFTPSQYNKEHHKSYFSVYNKASHGIIGQEFDNVAVVIDQFFSYSNTGELMYRGGSYYHPVKMLFQNITRTRNKLSIVIINNSELLNRCIAIV
ncbi:ATP-binding protein [Shewanella sp. 4t3-1-2LB]|uniref:ATP-binding protein n=1 Tax=Shewanella sp. 4t3-1-2LB TaxID=2817682 RepID=UPI001A995393|nr:ATP-binding protein [Shewanella sp. 4t3-1-2LB]MBO1271243.1 ATP-binding protein [Shewanella sp. 4t3-1-2LB]